MDRTLFPVGTSVDITATASGELLCFANDANALYFDNSGSINVTVSRLGTSWPPSTVYNENYVDYFATAPDLAV